MSATPINFPTVAELAFLATSAAGWTYVATRTAGPFGVIAKVRRSWPAGPLACPTCTGVWLGAIVAAGYVAARAVPELAPALAILAAAGAVGGLATLATWTAETVKALHELVEHLTYAAARENVIFDEDEAAKASREKD